VALVNLGRILSWISLAAAVLALAAADAAAQLSYLPPAESVENAPFIAPIDPSAVGLPEPAGGTFAGTDSWPVACEDVWHWQILPDGIIYKSYLAGVQESRLAAHLINIPDHGWMLDGNLGGKFGLIRYGNQADVLPQGFQFDIEGSAHVRLDIPEDVDVRSTDYRAGGTFTWGFGHHQVKFGYYHVSSHLGDEFVLKNIGNPGFVRLNFTRDVILLGYGHNVTPNLRLYAEAGWAFATDVALPWEFQFGLDWAPAHATGIRGAPFVAINGHLREELNYAGNFVLETGWAWRADENGQLFRTGLFYFTGDSNQFSFFNWYESQIGFGLWYDY
jgi:hypothetical protein